MIDGDHDSRSGDAKPRGMNKGICSKILLAHRSPHSGSESAGDSESLAAKYLFTQPAPQGDDQAVFAHTVMAPAPSWEEGV